MPRRSPGGPLRADRAPFAEAAVDHDDPIEELFEDQLRCADLVIVSKADLVSAASFAETQDIIRREMRAGTSIVRGGAVPAEVLLGIAASAEGDMIGRESHHDLEGEEHDHDDFVSHVFEVAPVASLDALKAKVSATLAIPGVLRVKGRVGVAGKAAPAVVQAVGPRVEIIVRARCRAVRSRRHRPSHHGSCRDRRRARRIAMHLLAGDVARIDDGDAAVDLGQPPGDIIFLSAADTELAALAAAASTRGRCAERFASPISASCLIRCRSTSTWRRRSRTRSSSSSA